MPAARVRQWLPGALYGPPLRWTTPVLAGRSDRHHIALTIDDGPDQRSTPSVLKTLARFDVRATFFVIGEHVDQHRDLILEMTGTGHEIAVHGWTHTSVLRLHPDQLRRDLARTADLLTEITGTPPRWYRPPYGIMTLASRDIARTIGLTPVLWTAWGRDWSRYVTSHGIVRQVNRTLRTGGTVLLHDTDRYAAPDSWRRTDRALEILLRQWQDAAIPVGPLGEHWPT